jgi:hypothetical protein
VVSGFKPVGEAGWTLTKSKANLTIQEPRNDMPKRRRTRATIVTSILANITVIAYFFALIYADLPWKQYWWLSAGLILLYFAIEFGIAAQVIEKCLEFIANRQVTEPTKWLFNILKHSDSSRNSEVDKRHE